MLAAAPRSTSSQAHHERQPPESSEHTHRRPRWDLGGPRHHTLQTLSSALPLIPDGRFQANQDDRTILFSDATGAPTTRASFAIVGTYSTRTDSWLWGWANERPRAVVARLKREGSAVLPGLGTFTLDPTLRFRPEPWASA